MTRDNVPVAVDAVVIPGRFLGHAPARRAVTRTGGGNLGLVGWSVFPQGLQIFGQEKKTFAHAFVLLASFLYLSVLHEILKFVVSAQTQHFLAAAGRIPSPQRRLNDQEERLEFIGFRAG